jgi:hypothetical protein
MPLSVLIFYTRRPDFTPAQFKSYMEEIHVPILKEIMGGHYPTTYTRRYVERVGSGAGDRLGASVASRRNSLPDAPVVLVGLPQDLGWDMMGELLYFDQLHLQQSLATINSDSAQRVKDDEENFTIPHLFRVVLMGESTDA